MYPFNESVIRLGRFPEIFKINNVKSDTPLRHTFQEKLYARGFRGNNIAD